MTDEKGSSLDLSRLTALSPLDGRYRETISSLASIFSEYGLMRQRLEIECKWLFFLSNEKITTPLNKKEIKALTILSQKFSLSDAEKIKRLEKSTRHDVKALEMFMREKLSKDFRVELLEYIHFGLTSEDVNNLSYRLLLKNAALNVMLPSIDKLVDQILEIALKYKNLSMLARTHGQPAVPTTLGKELIVFAVRINNQARLLDRSRLYGKVTGAVGSYNALAIAFPKINWLDLNNKFIRSLGLNPNIFTTQINPYEDLIEHLQIYQRINSVLIDFNQDLWRYISDNWLVQEVKKNEVGSSTMPQKINPIHFENSEGNLGVANSITEHLARKLPVSRLQRDLSDSTVIRNIGSVLGYSLIGYTSSIDGLERVRPNEKEIRDCLEKDWSILSEGVQTILRREGVKDAYSQVKTLTRGEHISKKNWLKWIDNLAVKSDIKKELKKVNPDLYIGLSAKIVDEGKKSIDKSRNNN